MKKRYITPEIEMINCMPGSVMTVPSLGTGTGEDGDPIIDDGNEATGSARGDWDNIWKNM